MIYWCVLFFQAEDGIRDIGVTGVQTCALPIWGPSGRGLRLPEDPVDLGDVVQQLLALGRVHAALPAGGARLLGGARKSVVPGKSVDLGGRRIINKNQTTYPPTVTHPPPTPPTP